MESRKKTLYSEIFEFLRDECFVHPRIFISDYETPMRSAAASTWPGVEMPGCAFHFRQAQRRNYEKRVANKPDRKTEPLRYQTHGMVRRMIGNLQMLPVNDIREGVLTIYRFQRDNFLGENVQADFLELNFYLYRYWITVIEPKNFSMHGKEHRTNNTNESFNSRLSHELPCHPNIYHFLHNLKIVTISENQRDPKDYRQQSTMTDNLEMGWHRLGDGQLTIF